MTRTRSLLLATALAAAKLSDVKVVANVVITGTRQADGTVLAATIQELPAGGGCFGGRRGRPSAAPTGQSV